jgi:hypothetical protein
MAEMKQNEDILSDSNETAENSSDQAQAPAQDESLDNLQAELG